MMEASTMYIVIVVYLQKATYLGDYSELNYHHMMLKIITKMT